MQMVMFRNTILTKVAAGLLN